jgi:molybdenum cofactor cytidylyltransferase
VKFGPVRFEAALGKILGHNVAGADGRRRLRKGRALTAEDLEVLRGLGRTVVYVAEPGPEDVVENEAARRVAAAAAGPGVEARAPAVGRVNLHAQRRGVLRVHGERLSALNGIEGVTVATLTPDTAVGAGQLVATVKIVPYAVAGSTLARAEAAGSARVLSVDALAPRRVGLILSGSPSVRERVQRDFGPPLSSRVEALGSSIAWTDFVPLEDDRAEDLLAAAIGRQRDAGAGLVLLAGETAIVDARDIAPRAVEKAGGRVEVFGAPVDPGNLLLLAYLGDVPVVGAPGCARSRRINVVDWVLPRLLAGELLTRRDVAAMGAGGLLEDVPERPMPRSADRASDD